jgi:hypothetical protein
MFAFYYKKGKHTEKSYFASHFIINLKNLIHWLISPPSKAYLVNAPFNRYYNFFFPQCAKLKTFSAIRFFPLFQHVQTIYFYKYLNAFLCICITMAYTVLNKHISGRLRQIVTDLFSLYFKSQQKHFCASYRP